LGHARAGARQKGVLRDFALPTPAEARRFSRLLAVWNAASDLDDDSFRERFARGLDIGPATLRRLRQAAAGSAQAQTIGQMIEASYPLTAAIKDIGGHRWPAMLEGLEDLADSVTPPRGTASLSGLAAGDAPDSSPKLAMAGALGGALALSPEAIAALGELGLAEAFSPAAMVAAFIAAVLIEIGLLSNEDEDDESDTLPDGTRYRLVAGPDGYSLVITTPDGKEIPVPNAPDQEVRDSRGQVIGYIRDGIFVITQPDLTQNPGKACPEAVGDKRGRNRRMARVYEAYIQMLINQPPTKPGKGVPLPTPWWDMLANWRRFRRVMFDDCQHETGIMIEAKGLGYATLLRKNKERTLDQWKDQARRQASAAEAQGRPLVWFFAEKAAADAARALFEREELKIIVIYMPLPGARR
jgi:hypothetical protein